MQCEGAVVPAVGQLPDCDEAFHRPAGLGADVPSRDAGGVTPSFETLDWPDDAEAAMRFLTSNEWPFHGSPCLSDDQAAQVRLAGNDVASFWIRADNERIGLIRAFDLDDLDDGSPLLDLRIAEGHRGRGVGRAAVTWLTDHLFSTLVELHRIEATTRHDNVAMQRVFEHCSYRLEGRMLEAWKNADGTRSDTLTYAILRREWRAL
jgi:RimJ/RimL family protein N-acetyltransferase